MLNLLTPFLPLLTAGVSGLANLFGAQSSASAQRQAAIINATMQQQQNAANQQAVAQANALTDKRWLQSFREARKNTQIARQDAARANISSIRQANIDRQIQKDFAQHGVQWRAQDARRAGIHPLAALGMQAVSSSPVAVMEQVAAPGGVPGAPGFSSSQGVAPHFPANVYKGQALANMGQDLSRAIAATSTELQRDRQVESAQSVLSLQNMRLQNDLLSAQIARTRGAGIGPAAPSLAGNAMAGQGNTAPLVEIQPQKQTAKQSTGVEAGAPATTVFNERPGGWLYPQMTKSYAEQTEDNYVEKILFTAYENIGRTFNLLPRPSGVRSDQGFIPFMGYAPPGPRLEGHDVRGRF